MSNINIRKFYRKEATNDFVLINTEYIVSVEYYKEGQTAIYLADGRKYVVEYTMKDWNDVLNKGNL